MTRLVIFIGFCFDLICRPLIATSVPFEIQNTPGKGESWGHSGSIFACFSSFSKARETVTCYLLMQSSSKCLCIPFLTPQHSCIESCWGWSCSSVCSHQPTRTVCLHAYRRSSWSRCRRRSRRRTSSRSRPSYSRTGRFHTHLGYHTRPRLKDQQTAQSVTGQSQQNEDD